MPTPTPHASHSGKTTGFSPGGKPWCLPTPRCSLLRKPWIFTCEGGAGVCPPPHATQSLDSHLLGRRWWPRPGPGRRTRPVQRAEERTATRGRTGRLGTGARRCARAPSAETAAHRGASPLEGREGHTTHKSAARNTTLCRVLAGGQRSASNCHKTTFFPLLFGWFALLCEVPLGKST